MQFSVLSRLEDEGPMPLGRLAERLVLERSTLTRELEPLLRDGFVRVAPDEDRRRRIVDLTPAGRARLRVARPAWEQAQAEVRLRAGGETVARLMSDLRTIARL
jgi:DNA-binding MarR family transcriptional regulator